MKIGKYDINYTDELKINQILSEFFGFECKVIDGIRAGIGTSYFQKKMEIVIY